MTTPGLFLQPLTRDDIDAARRLSDAAGWNQTAPDWRLIITHGHAFGLFEADGTLVATAVVIPFAERLAWISMVLVTPTRQRLGLATQLLRHGLAAAEQAGLVPMLDATEAGRPVYTRLGFTDLYAISRWAGTPPPGLSASAAPGSCRIRPMAPADLDGLVAWDRARFGVYRKAVLRHCWETAPHLAFVAEDAGGALRGYCLGRPGRLAPQLGPLVADDAPTARLLIRHVLGTVKERLCVDVPEAQAAFAQALIEAGFTRQRGFTRMVKGATPPLHPPERIYAIAGPDWG